jgi:uncharacterized protein (DUF1697 family)
MPVIISMLRAVNVGQRRIKMEDLRALYESLKLRGAQTYVQSGNVIFKSEEPDMVKLGLRIEKAVEKAYGFHSDVILRTASELKAVVANNPFVDRSNIHPSKLLVLFLAGDPGAEARSKVLAIKTDPEELRVAGREVFIHYPNGMGQTKLSWMSIEKALKTTGTGRNWNSVTKMLEIAEKM